ncbi:hypothetical protein CEXT_683531 [Caerostris extrusa]|uniref:Uncharacterized protein n=1 Tax=Caerostris extrusa TaxID=172846 RepID=A0AAV4NF07_CAEEX|nr:hypothetical protein CEXT_683531 [Caerostris extrusa]
MANNADEKTWVSSTFEPPTAPPLASRHAGERRANFRQQQPRSGHSREHRNPDAPPNYLEVAVGANGTSDYPVVVEEKKDGVTTSSLSNSGTFRKIEHRNHGVPTNYSDVAVSANGRFDYPAVVEDKRFSSLSNRGTFRKREHCNHDTPPNYTDVAVDVSGRSDCPSIIEGKKVESPPTNLTVAPLEIGVRF